ncbi:MAG: hypothetical protein ACSLFH_02815 [Desulfuromonadales bacterium]
MTAKLKLVSLAIAGFSALVLSGCVDTSMLYRGNQVSPVHVVTLQESGSSAGTWQTFDLVIDYKYTQNGDALELSAQAELGQHQQALYEHLKYFYFYFFFVDKDSRVLETFSIDNFFPGKTDERVTFTKSYKIPDGTTGFSFGYSGNVSDQESHLSFYLLPLSQP